MITNKFFHLKPGLGRPARISVTSIAVLLTAEKEIAFLRIWPPYIIRNISTYAL